MKEVDQNYDNIEVTKGIYIIDPSILTTVYLLNLIIGWTLFDQPFLFIGSDCSSS